MRTAFLLLTALLHSGAGCAAASEGVLGERFSIAIGGFDNTLTLSGRVDDARVIGSQFDFAEQFEFDNRRRLDLAELRLRPAERHEFGIKAFRDARERSAVLRETLVFDGREFLVDAEAVGRASLHNVEFDYTWWAWVEDDTALGLQVGVLSVGTSLSVRGRIRIEGEGEVEGAAAVSDRFFVPLAGLALRQRLGERWRLDTELRYLRRSYRGIEGEALSGHAGIEWLFSRHFSLVAQYGFSNVDLEQDKSSLAGTLRVGFKGPQAMLRLRF